MASKQEPKSQHCLLAAYGSETGTAESYAKYMAMECRRYYFSATLKPLDDLGIDDLKHCPAVFIACSTTGQGEEPGNMRKFWKNLRRRGLPSDSLSGMQFGLLAFGDSGYAKFNFAGKKLFRRLVQLGATPLCDIGLADDQHEFGAEATAGPFIANFLEILAKLMPIKGGKAPIPPYEVLPPSVTACMIPSKKSENVAAINFNMLSSESKPATLIQNVRATAADHFQDTRFISFDIEDCGFSYEAGNAIEMCPENAPNIQQMAAEVLGLNPADLFKLSAADAAFQNLPQLCSIEFLLKSYWDFSAVPGVIFFRQLSRFAGDELEKEKLSEFCSLEGQEDLIDYCIRPKRSILEVLQDFHRTAKIVPLSHLFDILPQIKPRAFSIASNLSVHLNEVQILVAVVRYKTMISQPRLGLCSNWLAKMEIGTKVHLRVRPGLLKIPMTSDVKCIFIAAGTGIAPVRNILHERIRMGCRENFLFFGFRSTQADFYFREDFEQMIADGYLAMFTAPSRDSDKKVYVQHRMKEHAKLIFTLISNDAYVAVAGNAKEMPKGVIEAFVDIFQEFGNLDKEQANEFVDKLQRANRLQFETWS